MGFIADGLIFKDLTGYFRLVIQNILPYFWRSKPLKIRPLPGLGGIFFEISSFEEQP